MFKIQKGMKMKMKMKSFDKPALVGKALIGIEKDASLIISVMKRTVKVGNIDNSHKQDDLVIFLKEEAMYHLDSIVKSGKCLAETGKYTKGGQMNKLSTIINSPQLPIKLIDSTPWDAIMGQKDINAICEEILLHMYSVINAVLQINE